MVGRGNLDHFGTLHPAVRLRKDELREDASHNGINELIYRGRKKRLH